MQLGIHLANLSLTKSFNQQINNQLQSDHLSLLVEFLLQGNKARKEFYSIIICYYQNRKGEKKKYFVTFHI